MIIRLPSRPCVRRRRAKGTSRSPVVGIGSGHAGCPIHQYLPRLVREWDDRAPGQLHQAIDGSMVFVDVSGFTKMSERLARHGKVGAEEVTEVIGGTFERLLGEAYAYGASLLKFGGDALLLFFQGERSCSPARRGCRGHAQEPARSGPL